jgi:uridine kinase
VGTPRGHLLAALARLVVSRRAGERPLRVAIDGVDTAGKTTLADELGEVLTRERLPTVRASLDGFHLPRSKRYARGPESPEGFYFDSFDYGALDELLLGPLGPGGSRTVRTAVFDSELNAPVHEPPLEVDARAILIFDGIFLLRPELVHEWDVSVFLRIEFEEVVRRGRARDGALLRSADQAEARYRRRYIPGQRMYLAEAEPELRADVLIDNSDPVCPIIERFPVL